MTGDDRALQRARRKAELADAAIGALKQLGYAQTGLRDIAAESGVALGTLHYHFADKAALMDYCVRRYKAGFLAGMQDILSADLPEERLLDSQTGRLARAIRQDAQTHRLWYDIRNQAMFDRRFEAVVAEIEADLISALQHLLRRLNLPTEMALPVYLQLDATFRYHLQRHLAGDSATVEAFTTQVASQFSHLLAKRHWPG